MTKFKINKNKDLPDEVINRHKDFGKLMDNHSKLLKYKNATKPLYKHPGFMSFMLVIGVVLLTYIITERENNSSSTPKDSIAVAQPKIQKKSDSVILEKDNPDSTISYSSKAVKTVKTDYLKPEIKFATYTIDPKLGASVYHKSTRILIPSNAFRDAKGNSIQTEVEIRYREFKDPVDAYLAGIPMHYDSTNQEYLLESAGMFEIRGYSHNEPVYIQKPLKVEYASPEHGKYNTYLLDEEAQDWVYKGIETQYMRFMIHADEKEYPELKPFKNLIWEFAVNDQQKDPSQFRTIFSKTWSSFKVSEAAFVNTKDVKIKQHSSESNFFAHPVPVLHDDEANKNLMKAKFDEYYSLLKVQEKVARDIQEAQRRQEEWINSPQGKAYLQWTASEEGQKQLLSSRVVSVFAVNQFGIWNCDRPFKIKNSTEVIASYVDKNNKKLTFDAVYLADYSVNSLCSYYKDYPVKFNSKSKNILWAPLPDGKMAVFSSEKFKSLKSENGKYTFKMEVVDVKDKNANDVRRILGMQEHITAKAEEKDKNPVATYERMIQLKKPLREPDSFYKSDVSEIDEGYKMQNK